MKALKQFFIYIFVWFAFGNLTTRLVEYFYFDVAPEAVYFVNMILTVLPMLIYSFYRQIKEIVLIIYYLLTLPFRLLRRKKEEEEGYSLQPSDRTFLFITLIIFSLGGYFLQRAYEVEYLVVIYLVFGLIWGLVLTKFFPTFAYEEEE